MTPETSSLSGSITAAIPDGASSYRSAYRRSTSAGTPLCRPTSIRRASAASGSLAVRKACSCSGASRIHIPRARGSARPGPSGRSGHGCRPAAGRARAAGSPAPWPARAAPLSPPRACRCRRAPPLSRPQSPTRSRAGRLARARAAAAATAPAALSRHDRARSGSRRRTISPGNRLRALMASATDVVKAYFEALNSRDLDAAVELWHPGGIDHFVGDQEVTAPEGSASTSASCSRRSRTCRSRSRTPRPHGVGRGALAVAGNVRGAGELSGI